VPSKIDLVGHVFGQITVLREAKERRNGKVYWLCRCSCGTEKPIAASALRGGLSRTCGCSREVDIAGRTFGRMTALHKSGTDSTKRTVWMCRCTCGTKKRVRLRELMSGATRSTMHEPQRLGISTLWRQGHPSIGRVAKLRNVLQGHGVAPKPAPYDRKDRQ
jgi:CDGSH-type Zn-finger protein